MVRRTWYNTFPRLGPVSELTGVLREAASKPVRVGEGSQVLVFGFDVHMDRGVIETLDDDTMHVRMFGVFLQLFQTFVCCSRAAVLHRVCKQIVTCVWREDWIWVRKKERSRP